MTHRQLIEDLALFKSSIYIEVPLGSVWLENPEPPRADLVTVKCSYERYVISVYEVKATRSDFMKEIRSGKWKKYLDRSHRLYFATAQGIAHKKEIPDQVGWIERGPGGWATRKRASIRRDVEIPKYTLLALIFYRQKRFKRWDDRRLLARYGPDRQKLRQLGKEIARALEFYNRYGKLYPEILEWQNKKIKVAMNFYERYGKIDLEILEAERRKP